MKDKDYIKDLFSEKLSNHEVPVRVDLWSGIQSQLGNATASTVVAKGISLSLKWMIGVASSVAIIGTTVWISSKESKDNPKKLQITQNAKKKFEREEKISSTQGSISSTKEDVDKLQDHSIVPQVEIPNVNYLDEWISREGQLYGLDNFGNPALQPKDETISNPMITESVSSVGAAASSVSSLNQEDQKSFEDGKIEEFVNVFTPNGDGINDVFFLNSENLKEFTMRIFNERNQLVFQTTDKDFKWYGLDAAGNMVESGDYGYVIFATDLNGKSVKMFKTLTIR